MRAELKSDRVPVIRGIELQQPRVQIDASQPELAANVRVTLAVLPGAEVKSRTYLRLERARLLLGDFTVNPPDEDEPPVEALVALQYESQSSRLIAPDILAFSSDAFSDTIKGEQTTNQALSVLCDEAQTQATLIVEFDAYYVKFEEDPEKVEPYVVSTLVPLECTSGA